MGFTVYMRLFVESIQFMLLSSISEINDKRFATTENISSFGFAIFILLLCIIGTIFVLLIIFSKVKFKRFFEVFAGLKKRKLARHYILMSMFIRKIAYIAVMI